MDRSLDEIIGDYPQRGGRGGPPGRRPPPSGPRGPRRDRDQGPRDGVRKYRREEPTNIDNGDWVHDRFEDDRYDRRPRRPYDEDARYEPTARAPPSAVEEGTRIRVDNLHYELSEEDLRELFSRIAPPNSVRMVYDRYNRSEGTAYVTYADYRDARDAVASFDGQNAYNQPIKLTILPSAPRVGGPPLAKERSLFDRVEQPVRSLFDRIDNSGVEPREDSRRRRRSMSPRVPDGIDRYVPGAGRRRATSRSPIRRRGTPAEGGRRPGERRERGGGGAGGRGRGGRKLDEEGRASRGGRPRKTAEELDAEMADYFNKEQAGENGAQNGAGSATGQGNDGAAAGAPVDDTDMIG